MTLRLISNVSIVVKGVRVLTIVTVLTVVKDVSARTAVTLKKKKKKRNYLYVFLFLHIFVQQKKPNILTMRLTKH